MPETPPADLQNLAGSPPPAVAHQPNMSWCYRGTTASQPYGAPNAPKTSPDVVGPYPTPSPPKNPLADAPAQPKPPQTAPPHPHQAPPAPSSHATTTHHEHDHEPFTTYETHPTTIGDRLDAKSTRHNPHQHGAGTTLALLSLLAHQAGRSAHHAGGHLPLRLYCALEGRDRRRLLLGGGLVASAGSMDAGARAGQ